MLYQLLRDSCNVMEPSICIMCAQKKHIFLERVSILFWKRLTADDVIFWTCSNTPQCAASSSMPSPARTVLSTSNPTQSADRSLHACVLFRTTNDMLHEISQFFVWD